MLDGKNHDLDNVITPVDAKAFEGLLQMFNYPLDKIKFLIDGFTEGFDICYQGPKCVRHSAPNLKLRVGSPTALWNKVIKEVNLGQYAGPFETPPFQYFIQSPIGLVPKDGGKDVQLIFHLSFPKNRMESVNANTPAELCRVHYSDIDQAIRIILNEGNGKMVYIAKSDFKSAFRILGLKRDCWKWLVIKVKDPRDRKWYYFVDKCLPFGSSISCALFQQVSDAVAHVVKFRTKKELVNYLDDFLFAALLKVMCDEQLNTFLDVCKSINFPVAVEKALFLDTCIVFLGFLLNTVTQRVSVPVEKIEKAKTLVQSILCQKKVTVREIQKLCGFLNFLCRAIVPGRAFTRRLYAITAGVNLKAHHHVYVKAENRSDLKVWLQFLDHPAVYSRPFMDFVNILTADELFFYTDSSKNADLGCGGICYKSWFVQKWNKQFILEKDPSIGYLELYAVTVGILNWVARFANRRIIIFCDNMSVMHMINKSSSSCRNCMVLIRMIVTECLIHNVRVFASHVMSKANKLADLLSRMRFELFLQEANHLQIELDEHQTTVPHMLWPMEKIWIQ